MGAGLLVAFAGAALLRGISCLKEQAVSSIQSAAGELRPSMQFYLGEPVWWHPGWSLNSIARTSACAFLISSCAATLSRLIDPENSFGLGLWLGCTAAALLLWACALSAAGALGFWFVAWAVRTRRRRARCRRILRANGWPRVLVSPRLLEFSDPVWGRLPPHEHFALTPWSTRWHGGAVRPLNLYAALALAEELHRCPTDAHADVDGGGEDEPEDAAAGRMEELIEVLEHGKRPAVRNETGETEDPLRTVAPRFWPQIVLQPLGGAPDTQRRRKNGRAAGEE